MRAADPLDEAADHPGRCDHLGRLLRTGNTQRSLDLDGPYLWQDLEHVGARRV